MFCWHSFVQCINIFMLKKEIVLVGIGPENVNREVLETRTTPFGTITGQSLQFNVPRTKHRRRISFRSATGQVSSVDDDSNAAT